MAGCVPCFVIPLLLFIFHRYIQPILLKFWNPWKTVQGSDGDKKEECKFSCDCIWNKKKLPETSTEKDPVVEKEILPGSGDKVKEL